MHGFATSFQITQFTWKYIYYNILYPVRQRKYIYYNILYPVRQSVDVTNYWSNVDTVQITESMNVEIMQKIWCNVKIHKNIQNNEVM